MVVRGMIGLESKFGGYHSHRLALLEVIELMRGAGGDEVFRAEGFEAAMVFYRELAAIFFARGG